MLHLITGGTGDGKTLLAVYEILYKGMEKNRKANQLPRGHKDWEPLHEFRTNVKGINIPGVLPLEKDWRQYPDGTVCVYDESHKVGWFRTTGKPGLSDDPVITELDEHRHRGFEIYFITQYPTKIHNEVRQLIKHHIHLFRTLSMQRAMRWEWSKCVNDPYSHDDVLAQNGEIWEFPVEGFAMYQSASMHTHKFVMPKKVKTLLITLPFILLVFGALYWFLVRPVMAKAPEGGKAASAASPGAATPASAMAGSRFMPAEEWADAPVIPVLKGCALLSKSCRCWNGQGQQLRLTRFQCERIVAEPMPIDFSQEGGAGVSAVGPGAGGQTFQPEAAFTFPGSKPAGPAVGASASGPWVGDAKLPIAGR